MKEDIFQQLEELSRKPIADHGWIQRTRSLLVAYMRAHPWRRPMFLWQWSFFSFRAASATLVIFMIIVGTTGITFAAQESIPGDLLYSWKVGVETIESVFIVSSQSRATFEVQRTTKRLQEITELMVRKPRDQQLIAEAHQRLQDQVKTTAEEIDKIAAEDPQKAMQTAVELNATLEAHKEVLAQLAPKVDEDTKSQVERAVSAIEHLKVKTSDDVVLASPLEQVKADASLKIAEAKKKIDEVWATVSALEETNPLKLEAAGKLESAQDALSDSQRAFDENSYADAIIAAQSSMRISSETAAWLDASEKAGATVKDILAPPSPSASSAPSNSPLASANPLPTPSPSATLAPIPTPVLQPVSAITLNKTSYVPGETMVVTITATNPALVPLTLQWKNGCQVHAVVDGYPGGESCTVDPTSAIVPPQQTRVWAFTLTAPLTGGEHIVRGEVLGYGDVEMTFRVDFAKSE